MWKLLQLIATDPLYSSLALGFLTTAGGWLWRQLSDNTRTRVLSWEQYASDAGAWALLHAPPGANATVIATYGADELDKIIARVGIKVPDNVRAHLVQVMRGFITSELASRAGKV